MFRRGAYIGVAIPVLAFLFVAVFSGVDFTSLFAAGQGTGAADVNARFWNGADWNDNLTLTGQVTASNLTGTTTDIVLSGTTTTGSGFGTLQWLSNNDCSAGNYVRGIADDGTVTCEADTANDEGAVLNCRTIADGDTANQTCRSSEVCVCAFLADTSCSGGGNLNVCEDEPDNCGDTHSGGNDSALCLGVN